MNDLSTSEMNLQAIVRTALDEAKKLGVDEAEVAASHDVGLAATARLGEVENLEYNRDRGIGVTVYLDRRKGSASTSETSPEAVREVVRKAHSFARFTAADEHSGLADADLMCSDIVELDLDHPWELDAQQAIELAIRCEAAGLGVDKRLNNSEGATVARNRSVSAYGNSHGFFGEFAKTSHSITCVLLAEQGGEMQRDYYYSAARSAAELEAPEDIGREAARRTLSRLGARKLATTNAPVLFVPELARGFVGHAVSALLGGAQYRKASFLLDARGEKLLPDFVDILEQPHIPRGMASAAYDAEGVGTRDRPLVSAGVIEDYILSSYSARRLGLETTANAGGPHNLVVSANAGDFESLVAEMGTGLIVEELIGQGVNTVTGDYSRGAAGHWVENGEVQYPVHEVTIAGELRELYSRVERIGSDRDFRGGVRCGSLLVGEMKIAGA
ncbi:MAG: metalloprotease PmbA [Pseudomonadota bacterium]